MRKKYNYVYITTNLINGKQYVGDHSTDDLDDNYLGSGRPLFKNALKKYGKENFKRKILETFDTKEEAELNQEKYIKKFKTHKSYGGYNLDWCGGVGINGIGENNPMYQKSILDIWIKKYGEKNGKKKWEEHLNNNVRGKNNSMYGKIQTKESNIKNRNSQPYLGKKLPKWLKKKMSDGTKREKNPFYDKKHSEETKKQISESQKERFRLKRLNNEI